jgi:hypothetical protein
MEENSMTLRELIDSGVILEAFRVYWWDYEINDGVTVAEGQFEPNQYDINDATLDKLITRLYSVADVLYIEIEK